MKTLNLVYPEKSDIRYKISKFPDGQQQITMLPYTQQHYTIWEPKICQIKSRLNNWLDLELIACAVASLRELDVEEIHLYVPYILGARSDRKFEEGGNNYLKDVICPIINSLGFKTVTVLDPHSTCLEMGIKGFKSQTNESLLQIFINGQHNKFSADNILISPDAGASHKIYKLAEKINFIGDIITCSKERDVEGKLTKTIIPDIKRENHSKDFIIIDDICDGGATFINIAKALREAMNCVDIHMHYKLYLIVTHGIFSKGFTELSKYFDSIYCTNSYKDITIEGYQYKKEKGSNLIKQLNIF